MGDYSWIPQAIGGVAKAANSYGTADKANSEMQEAYRQMLANLQARFGDYDALGKAGYSDIGAQQVGPSALEGITNDPQARLAQQEALAALSELAANGGLSLADMAALNQIQGNLNRNDSARRQGTANEFAARGQLGAGAQLAMAMQGNQDAAVNANQRAESTAAQAQARALQAILSKGQMAGQMGNEDYRRKADAARARDAIEARNAAARTDASKYNNSLRGQSFEDELAKARGKTALTGDMNAAVFGQGKQTANTTLGKGSYTNELIGQGASGFGKLLSNANEGDSDADISNAGMSAGAGAAGGAASNLDLSDDEE